MKGKRTGHTLRIIVIINIVIISCKTVPAQNANNEIFQQSIITNTAVKTEIHELTIGDKVPDIVFENVLNYKNKKAKLSDFKGKLVILDIWSVGCISCIESFPKLEALQKQ